MGLFSVIGKAIGGVAKLAGGVLLGAANQATGGVAGKALSAVKGLVGGKPKAATIAANEDQPATAKQIALLNKLSPRVIRTESGSSRSEGWGFGPGRKRGAKPKPKRRSSARIDYTDRGGSATMQRKFRAYIQNPTDSNVQAYQDQLRKENAAARAKNRAQRPAKARTGKRRGSGRRGGLRPGMLDLAAMARAWKAAGKPGSWQSWIKTNPLRV